mmetsp:Transcript_31786/g.40816  ORF Transcript_31786/g.40816 Transcript_31786/m.40816 type:complete len:313 (+) Transcript_31786:133-1071(+)
MQRRAETVFDHFSWIQVCKCRVQFAEVFHVFHYGFGYNVDNFVRNGCAGHEGCTNTKGGRVAIGAFVHATWNGRDAVERVVSNQFFNFRTGDAHQSCVTCSCGFFDRGSRVADGVDHCVNVAVAQLLGHFGAFVLCCQRKVVHANAISVHDHFHGSALARTRVANVYTLAFKVRKAAYACVRARDHSEWLWVHREYRTHIWERVVCEFGGAVIGVVLPVRLRNAKFQLARFDGVDVVDGPASGFHGAADAVLFAAFVDQTADRTTSWVVNTGNATGTDGDKLLSGSARRNAHGGDNGRTGQFQFRNHLRLPS